MGSLSSRPKISTGTTTVQTSGSNASTSTPSSVASTADAGADLPSATDARRASLLSRSRGRFGTIITGFRGLLSGGDSAQRKTLLGE